MSDLDRQAGESSVEPQARQLVDALDKAWARNHEYNLNALKKYPSAQAILKAPEAVQVAVAIEIVERIGTFAERGKKVGEKNWFTLDKFPWGLVYFQKSLLKKRLPFAMGDLEKMFGAIARIGFISASQFEFIDPLIGIVEREENKDRISDGLRGALKKMEKRFLGKGASRQWDADAADRKAGQRIGRLLQGELELN